MNPFTSLRQKLTAKLNIGDASQALKEMQAILNEPDAFQSKSEIKASEIWEAAKAGNPPKFLSSPDAVAVLKLAVAEVNGKAPSAAPKSTTSPAVTAPAAKSPVVAATPKPSPAAAPRSAASPSIAGRPILAPSASVKPSPAPIATKPAPPARPDFSAMKGVEKVSATMKYSADRKAFFLAEAERQISEQEEAALAPPSNEPITASSLARAIVNEQEARSKPKDHAWSAQAFARSTKVKDLAAKLEREHSNA